MGPIACEARTRPPVACEHTAGTAPRE